MTNDLYLKVSVRSLNRRPTKEELKTALPEAYMMRFEWLVLATAGIRKLDF